MQQLMKSLFITGFIAWILVASLFALAQLVRGQEPLLSWFGLALASLSPLAFFTRVFLTRPPRTQRHPVEHSILGGLGLVMCMAAQWRYGQAAGAIHIWAGLSMAAWLAYLRWYSAFAPASSTSMAPGSLLPDFTLRNLDNQTINAGLLRGQPHILIFIRGNWCPFCMGQVEEMAASWQDVEAAGARVLIISSQPLRYLQDLAKRFQVPMQFLQDPENRAARQLGVRVPWGTPMGLQALGYPSDTARPAVFVVDSDGRIVHGELADNYRIRPEPAILLRVLKTKTELAGG